MFHWICPECGLEIAPTAKECPACEPQLAEAQPLVQAQTPASTAPSLVPEVHLATPAVKQILSPEPPLIAAPQIPVALLSPASPISVPAVAPPLVAPAPVSERLALPATAPARPASLALKGAEITPQATVVATSTFPQHTRALPSPSSAAIVRPPKAAIREIPFLSPRTLEIPSLELAHGPETEHVTLPRLSAPNGAEPRLGGAIDHRAALLNKIRPAKGNTTLSNGGPVEQISLPGPTLPHELTSLDAAGIARILSDRRGRSVPEARSGWFVSALVASGFFAVAIAAVFYAVPGLARPQLANSNPAPKAVETVRAPEPAPPVPERHAPAALEVTGIRFVTNVPNRAPQIHYLVVNHTPEFLNGVVVHVTLRAAENQPPLSQFSFRSPRLGAFESKEMVSSIERLNRPLDLPDWRDVRADVEILP